MLRVADCITDRIRLVIPQPTKWQRIGNQIDAAFVFARADFVKVHRIFFAMLQRDGANGGARLTLWTEETLPFVKVTLMPSWPLSVSAST